MTRRERRDYTDEFKEQMVKLHGSGKRKSDLIREYELTPSSLNRWIQQHQASGSFREKDNRTEQEHQIIRMQKELQQLRMENDILKQAALIIGRK